MQERGCEVTDTTPEFARSMAYALHEMGVGAVPDALRSLAEQLEAVTAERDKCGSGAGCLYKDAMIDSLTAEVTRVEAELADMRKVWLGAQAVIAELKAKLAALEGQEPVQPMSIDEVNDAWAAASHHHKDEMDVFALVRAVEAHHGVKGARE